MQFQISGHKINIGDALSEHVKDELTAIITKYAARVTNVQVVFSKVAHEHQSEVNMHLTTGMNVNATGRAVDIYDSFNKAANRIEKQLRRYKRRLKDHQNNRTTPVESFGAASYILSADQTEVDTDTQQDMAPPIIAEMETKVKSLSVGEAVMQMELSDQDVLVFRNEGHKGINVVYRRKDGNIGWIDPQLAR